MSVEIKESVFVCSLGKVQLRQDDLIPVIYNEENYRRLKDSIRITDSSSGDSEKNRLTETGKYTS